LLQGTDECSREDFFCIHLITGHVEGKGKSTMTVAFIDVPLLLLAGLFGSLRDDRVRFSGKLAFKIEQGYPGKSPSACETVGQR
jgi:hypothetical protein